MAASSVSYGGYEIVMSPETNKFGAWVTSVSLKDSTGRVVERRPMTVQPEWRTEEEAIRDAVEWGSRFIERELNTSRSHSWVVDRSRAEIWFRDVQEKSRGLEIDT
jgi:hypothetical protein